MHRTVFERPELAGSPGFRFFTPKQARTNAEQEPPSLLQTLDLRFSPRKRFKQRSPRVFKQREFITGNATQQKFARNRLQPRFGRRRRPPVQFFESFSPPCEPDGAEPGIARRRHDVREGEIQVPQGRKGGSQPARQLAQDNLAVRIETAFSDR